MASYSVRLYKNTGFDLTNIPDSESLLDENTHIDVDAIWVYQNQEQGTIRVKSDFNNLYSVDYCRIGTADTAITSPAYYFVTRVAMINPVTAELSLQIDAVTTIGLTDLTDNILDGWCTRRCVTDDSLFSNEIEEDFVPANELSIVYQPLVDNTTVNTIIASSVDLDQIVDSSEYLKAKTFIDDITGNYVAVPSLPIITEETEIIIQPASDSREFKKTIPNVRLYAIKYNPERYKNALGILWSLGAFDSITAMYQIANVSAINVKPDDSIGASGSIDSIEYKNTSEYNRVIGSRVKYTINNYTIKNNKVYGHQFNRVTLASYVSGDSLDYDITRIVSKEQGEVDEYFYFWTWNDPSPGGKSYIRPAHYSGIDYDKGYFAQLVMGSNWPNAQTVMQNAQGWAVNQKIYAERHSQELTSGVFNLLNSVGSVANMFIDAAMHTVTARTWGTSGVVASPEDVANRQFINFGTIRTGNFRPNPSVVGDLLGNAESGLNLSTQKNINNLGFQASNGLVSPTVKFPIDNSMIQLVGNGFYMIRTSLSDNDSIRYDKYLTMYGYRVSEPLTKECFYGRQYFNYIECVNLSLRKLAGNFPLRLKQLAINQLQNGVRIWHTQVNQEAFNENPIIGG